MKRLYTVLFCLIFSFSAWSQDGPGKSEAEHYAYAKKLVDQGNYQPAITILEKTLLMKNASHQPYVLMLMATANYKEGNFDETLQNLNQIETQYSDWNNKEEVTYLKGCSYLKKNDLDNAIASFSDLKTDSYKKDVDSFTQHYVNTLTIDELKTLSEKYNDNEILKVELLEKLQSQPKDQVDQILLEKLAEELGIAIHHHVIRKTQHKDVYNVAVVLPFFTESTDGSALRVKNEFVYNIYQGILIAKDYLEKRNVKLNVLTFDTKRDTAHVKEILSQEDFNSVDLIIGPLYADIIPVVQKFSSTSGIPMVNPISSNNMIIDEYPNSFLATSTHNSIGKYLGTKLRKKELENLELLPEEDSIRIKADTVVSYVIFGHSTKEKEMAKSFKEAYEKDGGKIAVFQEYDPVDGFNVAQELFDPLGFVDLDSIQFVKDSTAHVFISVTNEVAALSTVSALLSLGTVSDTYVPEEWLKFKQLSYTQMESARINILYPNWYNDDTYNAKTFIKKYQDRFNNQPSDFVFKGFETMFTFGNILKDHGNGFVKPLMESEALKQGYMQEAYNYYQSQDNQYIPIIQFVDGDLKNMTPPKFDQ
ncbi:outer membrane protein assembly factor BamD [Flammeovirga pacifica]|uniref:Outer membrane lipoprotein BamD-like domain-containing protein n=1 Tax=Flammeovirga pacifica TaxID=915059 RepID=A0A1S1Z1R2_FLAPC|nr:outer membrane protein assembly factor BamD [Flammeovirga pacifica]OHX67045.1 hypothetical protein NH26_12165 [Flammeovirga pacifica]